MKLFSWCKSKIRKEHKEISFTKEDAENIAKVLKIDFNKVRFNIAEFTMGLNVELEHGTRFPEANVTNNNPILTGKIALAHLLEFPDYYTRLKNLEYEAKLYWVNRK